MGVLLLSHSWNPPSFVGSMCPEIRPSLPKYLHALRPGLSPNITLHIPTLINRKKESKHHGWRNRRQKVSLNRVGHATSKENLHRIFFLTWPPRVRVLTTYDQQQIFMNFILNSGVFWYFPTLCNSTLIAVLLLCYLPLFGYHRRVAAVCHNGLEHRWKQIVLERGLETLYI